MQDKDKYSVVSLAVRRDCMNALSAAVTDAHKAITALQEQGGKTNIPLQYIKHLSELNRVLPIVIPAPEQDWPEVTVLSALPFALRMLKQIQLNKTTGNELLEGFILSTEFFLQQPNKTLLENIERDPHYFHYCLLLYRIIDAFNAVHYMGKDEKTGEPIYRSLLDDLKPTLGLASTIFNVLSFDTLQARFNKTLQKLQPVFGEYLYKHYKPKSFVIMQHDVQAIGACLDERCTEGPRHEHYAIAHHAQKGWVLYHYKLSGDLVGYPMSKVSWLAKVYHQHFHERPHEALDVSAAEEHLAALLIDHPLKRQVLNIGKVIHRFEVRLVATHRDMATLETIDADSRTSWERRLKAIDEQLVQFTGHDSLRKHYYELIYANDGVNPPIRDNLSAQIASHFLSGITEKDASGDIVCKLHRYERVAKTAQAKFSELVESFWADNVDEMFGQVAEERQRVEPLILQSTQQQMAAKTPESLAALRRQLPERQAQLEILINSHKNTIKKMSCVNRHADLLSGFAKGIQSRQAELADKGQKSVWFSLCEDLNAFIERFGSDAELKVIQDVFARVFGEYNWRDSLTQEDFVALSRVLTTKEFATLKEQFSALASMEKVQVELLDNATHFYDMRRENLEFFLSAMSYENKKAELQEFDQMDRTVTADHNAGEVQQADLEEMAGKQTWQIRRQAWKDKFGQHGVISREVIQHATKRVSSILKKLTSATETQEFEVKDLDELLGNQEMRKTQAGRLLLAYQEHKNAVVHALKSKICDVLANKVGVYQRKVDEFDQVKKRLEECELMAEALNTADENTKHHLTCAEQHAYLQEVIARTDQFIKSQSWWLFSLLKTLARWFGYKRSSLPMAVQASYLAKDLKAKLIDAKIELAEKIRPDAELDNEQKAEAYSSAASKIFNASHAISYNICGLLRCGKFRSGLQAKAQLDELVDDVIRHQRVTPSA